MNYDLYMWEGFTKQWFIEHYVSGWTEHCKHISQHSQSYVEESVRKRMSVQCYLIIQLYFRYHKSGEDEIPPYSVVSEKVSWRW